MVDFDTGQVYSKTEGQPQKTGVIFKIESGQTVSYDGAGNKTWFADTTGGNVAILLPAASSDVALGVKFTINRVSTGANTLTITTEGGNLNGSASYALVNQGDSVTFQSDGTNYWSVSQPTPADVVTSASLSTALAPYLTSASFVSAVAGYMTSNSISAGVVTDALTVRGGASVSATLSAAAVTILGRGVGQVLLGITAINNVASVAFSGSWSDIAMLELKTFAKGQAGTLAAANIEISTDGGTTVFLNVATGGLFSVTYASCVATVLGVDNRAHKSITAIGVLAGAQTQGHSATASVGFINFIRFFAGASVTLSSGMAYLYGYRNA